MCCVPVHDRLGRGGHRGGQVTSRLGGHRGGQVTSRHLDHRGGKVNSRLGGHRGGPVASRRNVEATPDAGNETASFGIPQTRGIQEVVLNEDKAIDSFFESEDLITFIDDDINDQ